MDLKGKSREYTFKEKVTAQVCRVTGVSQPHVTAIINFLLEEITRELERGNKVKLKNFGTFELRKMKPKAYVNVVTKEKVKVERNRVLRFTLEDSFSSYVSKLLR